MEKEIYSQFIKRVLGNIHKLRNYKYYYSPPTVPKHIDIEVTNICNLHCIMCPSDTHQRERKFMSIDTYKKIIDELDGLKVKNIWLQVLGEPLLHPNIIEMVLYAKSKSGIKRVGFSTNCNLLDSETSRMLIEAGIDRLIFAIDGASKYTYEKIRVGGNYETVVNNILEFFKIRKEINAQKPSVRLQFIQMEDNAKEVDSFIQFWGDKVSGIDQVAIKPCDVWAEQVDDHRTEKQRFEGVTFEAWKSRMPQKMNNKSAHYYAIYRTPCWGFLFSGGSVLSNGDFTVCGLDVDSNLKLGNVSENTIYELWNGDKIKSIRENHLKLKSDIYSLCRSCTRTFKCFRI